MSPNNINTLMHTDPNGTNFYYTYEACEFLQTQQSLDNEALIIIVQLYQKKCWFCRTQSLSIVLLYHLFSMSRLAEWALRGFLIATRMMAVSIFSWRHVCDTNGGRDSTMPLLPPPPWSLLAIHCCTVIALLPSFRLLQQKLN